MQISTKRIYEAAAPEDGQRVLIDRLWPRGVSREKAALDNWIKDAAPSTTLRTWWNHDPIKMKAFATQYVRELDTDPDKQAAVKTLLTMARKGKVTLLYGAKNPQVNHALVLQEYLQKHG